MAFNGLLGNGTPKPSLAQALAASSPQASAPPPVTNIDPAMFGIGAGAPAEGPAYGSDEWALNTGGQGAMLWRELVRAMSSDGLAALAPENAGMYFSDESRALMAPAYQAKKDKGNG